MASDMSDGSVFGLDDESDAYVPEVVSALPCSLPILLVYSIRLDRPGRSMAQLAIPPVSHNRDNCLHCTFTAPRRSWITMADLFTLGSWSSSPS
jgi:hypothetical protein